MTLLTFDTSPSGKTLPGTRRLTAAAYAALFILVVILGGLSSVVSLNGAVVTSGRLVVASYPKPIQHLKGGIVAQLLVANGDIVKAGQILLRLDGTQTKANLAIVQKRLDELNARAARLLAEERGLDSVEFPPSLANEAKYNPDVASLIEGEQNLFAARRLSQSRRKDELSERVRQYEQEIVGLKAQIDGKEREDALLKRETDGVNALVEQKLLSITRLNDLLSQQARLEGELGGLVSSTAETKGKITETELQRLQVDDDAKSQAASDLRDAQTQIAEYEEREVSAEDDLAHVDIIAPQDGVVQDLMVHAKGAVIGAGTPIMTVVPVTDNLLAEVRIAPQDIDELYQGQKTMLRFSAFNQRTTPEIPGQIIQVAPDLTIDQKTGAGFYLVRIKADENELRKLGQLKLIAGMPVEAFVQTGERTIMSYLLKPVEDQINRAFKGD